MPDMTNAKVERLMKHHQTVSDVVATAMMQYARQYVPKANKAAFAFEADFIVGELARAGYGINKRRRRQSKEPIE